MHRLGLALGSLTAIIAVAVTASQVYDALTYEGGDAPAMIEPAIAGFIGALLIGAVAIYAACWTAGWIIAGFMRDE